MILESEPDMRVAGEAADGQQAFQLAERLPVDVLLMDVRMPGEDGIAATARILARPAPPRVLMLTTFDLDEYVYDALRAGASGFLLKDMPGEETVTAVRQAARGADALLAPAVTRRLIQRFTSTRPGAPSSTADQGTLTFPLNGPRADRTRRCGSMLRGQLIRTRFGRLGAPLLAHRTGADGQWCRPARSRRSMEVARGDHGVW